MSEQWTIENDTGEELTVRAPNGFAVELDANSADPRERFAYFAIRQQARDIAELRTDLVAAVSENAALLAANRDCILHFDAIKADYDVMKLRAEQAEARLAAIAAQPTLAIWGGWIDVSESDVPPDEAELIARPAKD